MFDYLRRRPWILIPSSYQLQVRVAGGSLPDSASDRPNSGRTPRMWLVTFAMSLRRVIITALHHAHQFELPCDGMSLGTNL